MHTVLNNFYVDDYLKSVSAQVQAVAYLQEELTFLCTQGGSGLTKWMSNSRVVLASIPEDDCANEVKDLDLDCESLPTERALGVQWSVEDDSF